MDRFEIYTDGSCKKNPGPGGWAMVVMQGDNILSFDKDLTAEKTTNNREELKAILAALRLCARMPEYNFIIYSDSAYCVNICNDWIYKWAQNYWYNSSNKIVENVDLIKEIYNHLNSNEEWEVRNFTIEKVSGHTGNLGNEIADALATNNMYKFAKLISKRSENKNENT